ncbi:hypothetical protein PG994_012383 [Apiospora phragmitis]|uniref:Uncharacterized protein n=1 Tax=Apiospora phragmitis TaxID=2905665 RepID=A0ABR1TVJ4_9PEZI
MAEYNTFYKKLPSTRSSRHTVQENQWTRNRPPHFIQENIPSGQSAGSSNEPAADELAQELESMAMSGKGEDALHGSPMGSDHTSTSNLTPSARPDIARYALMGAQDPAKLALTSETLKVFDDLEQGGNEHYPHVANWCTGPYNPGNEPFTIATAADLSDSMCVTGPARSQATDASWVVVSAPDEKLDRIAENISGAGSLFNDIPAEPAWDEYDVR